MFRYESPDESCYSESTSVAGRQKKRRRRKADVENNSTGKVAGNYCRLGFFFNDVFLQGELGPLNI